jgi:poly(3-hydroxybutyrate) depolymerase
VFHGDADHTVAASNGRAIVRDASVGAADITVETGDASGGRSYTRKIFADAAGRARGEHWLVHGTGHAWSGGSALGSYTDPAGPDASAEMVRFFLQQG